MAVRISDRDPDDIYIRVEEDKEKGEVRLVFNNHAFVVCKTLVGALGHVVQVVDVDTGIRHEAMIRPLCWMR